METEMLNAVQFEESVRTIAVDYRSPSDMLIPGHLMAFVLRMKRRYGEWSEVVRFLVTKYEGRILEERVGKRSIAFEYQPRALYLQRICYRPNKAIYARLRMLSFATRMSMCAIIVQMFEWEREGQGPGPAPGNISGIPTPFRVFWYYADWVTNIGATLATWPLRRRRADWQPP